MGMGREHNQDRGEKRNRVNKRCPDALTLCPTSYRKDTAQHAGSGSLKGLADTPNTPAQACPLVSRSESILPSHIFSDCRS